MAKAAAVRHVTAIGLAVWGLCSLAYAEEASGPGDYDDSLCTQDAMLVVDASGSMIQKDPGGESLLDGAREATKAVIPSAARFRNMGLVTLGPGKGDQCSNVELKVPLQAEAAASIIGEVDKLPADGGTPLSKAVEAAADALDYRSKPGVVVVVSDGDETCGRDPCELARRLHRYARSLTIHVIGFGASETIANGASCLADATRGRKVRAKDAAELTAALQKTLVCPQLSQAPAAALTGSIGRSTSR